MTARRAPQISARKQPRQTRSTELVATILEAAAQVLANEGAQRFTTARVAEWAGVSVGSLYQYFPNKAALLFKLQADEWVQTGEMLRGILIEDGRKMPTTRLRALVHAFVRSECDESALRKALSDAAPLYRDAPEMQEARAAAVGIFQAFMQELLPNVRTQTRVLAGDLIATTLTAGAKEFSERPHTPAEITAYAEAMADMFCAYITELA
ncbi:TetR family transcriptional regulator [Mycolicibacterium komossense]|uniref:TetR family transcriptional regulator n=1 Tax=Mycolicibacterium komossense TaxID=1779 RepID=A0ABT3CAJ5_9MYCO|nr:TetR family transcriptional regulator [Mycolicibacterium komossense]MCV7226261.1 TetR family transcriptional regulator [Mycolicibacterium komossense]